MRTLFALPHHARLARPARPMLAALAVLLGLTACAPMPQAPSTAAPAPAPAVLGTTPLRFEPAHKAQWEAWRLPGKRATEYRLMTHQGRSSLRAESQASASMLRQRLQIPPEQLGQLSFSWQVERLLDGADLSQAGRGDSPVRVVLAFDGDRSRWSPRQHMMAELARALTGEEMPYATLIYVWANHHAEGTVLHNARSDRVRKLVLDSGSAHLGQWRQHERDLRADFEQAFGEPPGALIGLALMTDSDNTNSHARAWYGPIELRPPAKR